MPGVVVVVVVVVEYVFSCFLPAFSRRPFLGCAPVETSTRLHLSSPYLPRFTCGPSDDVVAYVMRCTRQNGWRRCHARLHPIAIERELLHSLSFVFDFPCCHCAGKFERREIWNPSFCARVMAIWERDVLTLNVWRRVKAYWVCCLRLKSKMAEVETARQSRRQPCDFFFCWARTKPFSLVCLFCFFFYSRYPKTSRIIALCSEKEGNIFEFPFFFYLFLSLFQAFL